VTERRFTPLWGFTTPPPKARLGATNNTLPRALAFVFAPKWKHKCCFRDTKAASAVASQGFVSKNRILQSYKLASSMCKQTTHRPETKRISKTYVVLIGPSALPVARVGGRGKGVKDAMKLGEPRE